MMIWCLVIFVLGCLVWIVLMINSVVLIVLFVILCL